MMGCNDGCVMIKVCDPVMMLVCDDDGLMVCDYDVGVLECVRFMVCLMHYCI